MGEREPMVWEEIINEPGRQCEIEAKYADLRKQVEAEYEKVRKSKRLRMLEEAAKYMIFALACFTASALLIETNVAWASWLTGIAGVLAGMAASYQFGMLRGSNRK